MRRLLEYDVQRITTSANSGRGVHGDFNPRIPQRLATILADCSGSMDGHPIEKVNQGLVTFARECCRNALTRETLQVQLVTFGATIDVYPFLPIGQFIPPELEAEGGTPLPEAIVTAATETRQYVATLREGEIEVPRPLYFLFSDGEVVHSSEKARAAAACVAEAERTRLGAFYGFGVSQTAVDLLQFFFKRDVHLLADQDFAEFFRILSVSVSYISTTCIVEDPDLTPLIRGQLRLSYERRHHA